MKRFIAAFAALLFIAGCSPDAEPEKSVEQQKTDEFNALWDETWDNTDVTSLQITCISFFRDPEGTVDEHLQVYVIVAGVTDQEDRDLYRDLIMENYERDCATL